MITTYFKNLIMNEVFNTNSATTTALPTKYYLAYSMVTPPDDGIGTGFAEPSASTGYARVELTCLADAVNGGITNTENVVFNESIADQGIATAYGVYDSLTDGHLLLFGALQKPKTIEEGTTFFVRASQLNLTLSGI